MAKYVGLSVKRARELLAKGWSINGVWLEHSMDWKEHRSKVELRNVRGVISVTESGITDVYDSTSEKELNALVRMQVEAMCSRAIRYVQPSGERRLRPTEVRRWRVMSPEERGALLDDDCKAYDPEGPLLVSHDAKCEEGCEVTGC